MVNLSEAVRAITGIINGSGEYILLSGEEYKELQIRASTSEPKEKIKVKEVIKEVIKEPTSIVQKTYKDVELSRPDQYDDPADIEISNTPVYYIPVGDGLYRPTYSKSIFLRFACQTLLEAKMLESQYGDQFKCLVDNKYLVFDICLATKMKEREAIGMIGKQNDSLPFYIRQQWKACFDENCEWHPKQITIHEEVERATKQNIRSLKEAFGVDPDAPPIKKESVKRVLKSANFYYPPFIHHVTRENTMEPVNFKDYPNTLIVYTKQTDPRGKPKGNVNVDVVGAWIKQYPPTELIPFTNMRSFTNWMKEIPISSAAFWREFGHPSFGTNTRLTQHICDLVNKRFGFTLFAIDGAVNNLPVSKTEVIQPDDKNEENENEQNKIRNVLYKERKYGIRTLSRLFQILEEVTTRQQIIDLFHIQDEELKHPSDLHQTTAIEVNQFCGKQVCIGNLRI